MNADPAAQLGLLELQGLDSTLARLERRRRTLPELARLEVLAAEARTTRDGLVAAQTEDSDLASEQARLEADVDLVRQRSARDQTRLDTGRVSSPKDLENLQHEVATLARRQDDLEEQVLEVMERREAIGARIAAALQELQRLDAEQETAAAARDTALAAIGQESAAVDVQRGRLAVDLPDALLALYEKLRADHGGVGAAALHRGRCQGCQLALSAVDVARIRAAAPEEVLRCEECGRILVRTAESGL